MTAKQMLPNQCDLLHPFYGPDNCCLCREKAEVQLLKAEIERLRKALETKVEPSTTHLSQAEIDELNDCEG